MALTKYKLGELIERSTVNNKDLRYGTDLIAGVNNEGVFTVPKGNPAGVDLRPYKLVNNGAFVYNPTRLNLGSIAYRTQGFCIVSHLYIIFYLNAKGKDVVDPFYLYIYFHRDEFHREVTFRNFGSQRPEFSFNDMADLEITLPDIDQQRKFVDVYLALQNNLAAYQSKVDELKTVCDGYIEELRRKMPSENIGPYIAKESKNSDGKITRVLGIGQNGFMAPQKEPNESLKNYKILQKGDIAYAPPLFNVLTGALHCYEDDKSAVCSPIYEVFKCDKKKLLPEYLTMWLKRDEFKRYAEFYAQGVRQTFDFSLMSEIMIPIPNIEIQHSITDCFKVYQERKTICDYLKAQIKNICPILIKGSLQTAN